MSTWISSRSVFCLFVALTCAACEGGGGGLFAPSSDPASGEPRRDSALPGAKLAEGALTLVPPNGFCIDRRSLQQSFAVIARCDSLGAERAPDAPLGLIAVSVTKPADPQVDLAAALTALVPQGAELLASRMTEDLALAHLRGPVPEDADPTHWRGLARVGSHLLALTAYAPRGGALSGETGARVLERLVRRTGDASASSRAVPTEPNSASFVRRSAN